MTRSCPCVGVGSYAARWQNNSGEVALDHVILLEILSQVFAVTALAYLTTQCQRRFQDSSYVDHVLVRKSDLKFFSLACRGEVKAVTCGRLVQKYRL